MPLDRQDCIALTRVVQGLLRAYDPEVLNMVLRSVDLGDDPRKNLLGYLQAVGSIYSERSGGSHATILNRINHFVRLPDGSPVRSLSVQLPGAEQELFGIEEINLAELPDRSAFLDDLQAIIDQIAEEIESPGGLNEA